MDMIQPHGWLMVLDARSRLLLQAGANLPDLLGRPLDTALGHPVADLLGPAAARSLDRAITQAGQDAIGPLSLRVMRNGVRQRLIAHGHWDAAGLILEIEATPAAGDGAMLTAGFGASLRRYRHMADLDSLAQAAAHDLRRLTGYERVLLIRLADRPEPVILAQDAAPGIPDPSGVGFGPPSETERMLLELNRARVIRDMAAPAIPVLPADSPQTARRVDLRRAALRAPASSLRTRAALRGMRGVMVVALSVGGRLWGYLWCESRTPRALTPAMRALCEGLGEIVGAQIAALEERAMAAARTRAARGMARLGRHLREAVELADGLLVARADLTDIIPHDTLIIGIDGVQHGGEGGPPLSHWLDLLASDQVLRRDGIAWCGGLLGVTVPDGQVVLLRDTGIPWTAAELEAGQELHHLLSERQAEIYRRRTEQRLHVLAHFDPVTGLANRAHLLRALDQALGVDSDAAITVIGLDRFRAIKAALGEADADALLAAIASRLRTCVPPGDLLGRIDTGEFAVISFENGMDRADRLAPAVRDALRAPLSVAGREMFVTASLGVVFCDGRGNDAPALLRDAEIASAEAETAGGSGRRVFDDAMRARLTQRNIIYDRLRQAIYFSNGVRPAFQPIVRLSDGELVGFEALARWTDPEHGPIPPSTFVTVAEQTGLIVPLGNQILVQACRQAAKWNRDRTEKPLYVSVNLSPYQLDPSRLDIVRWVAGVLDMTECRPEWLQLEITESGLIGQGGEAVSILKGLRDLGIGLAIDDFGTGYSSLAYLQNLPVDTIKIDRSFVTAMTSDPKGVELVSAILHIVGIMEFGVVAEGVETEEQARLLTQMGCERGQGYLFSRPLEADAALAMVHHMPVLSTARPRAPILRAGRWG
ncbi:EAL domain-containing protein [Niveispirillum fermenti]|uniref:EAL domain-containing protein n=1 Tax=Niveispirillum fermenti TaxID=1233113 RepID=UPI003A8A2A16